MNKTEYMVFWIDKHGLAGAVPFNNLSDTLVNSEKLRKEGNRFVTIASEMSESVGKGGVDTVKDGKLPDGLEYVYKTGRDRGRDPR